MTHPEGGFYSAEDADSVIDPAKPHEKGEGAFYIWSRTEIELVLGKQAADVFCRAFGVETDGNVHADPHGEFTGRNILYQAAPVAEAERLTIASAKAKLLEARSKRIRPHLDDKILTAWNGLMVSAFALGTQVLEEPKYAEAARRAADFLLDKMYDRASGRLLRRFRDGDAAIAGFLDDYAFFANALVDLYETVFDLRYLETAEQLAASMISLFEDTEQGAFFSTAAADPNLVLRMKEDYDGAEPSGNSIAVLALLRLSALTGREDFRAAAERALKTFASRMRAAPVGVPQMLVAYMCSRSEPRQIVIAGEGAQAQRLLTPVRRAFLPNKVVFLIPNSEVRDRLSLRLPALAGMTAVDGKAAAYVCENFTCQLPATEPDALQALVGAASKSE
jgi:uncharacterized protein YyaL (SSP411 family)